MSVARSLILWAADNRMLRERLTRFGFVRRTVRRFMPGETLEDALGAAADLRTRGLPTTFTALGENVTNAGETQKVAEHYLQAFERIAERGLDTEISVKPTHLGLDLDLDLATANLERLTAEAAERGNWLWLDMEAHPYVDGTIELYRRMRRSYAKTGVCLQAYLKRTAADVDAIMPLDPSIRLVKGAYREPEELVFRSKRTIDEAYRRLALRILAGKGPEGRLALGTHDVDLLTQIDLVAAAGGRERGSFEVQMLFGIRADDQVRLERQGYPVRVLIAYGSYWYPWFMRRIAENPTRNVLLALRNLVG